MSYDQNGNHIPYNSDNINSLSRYHSGLLSRREAAEYLGVTEQTLAVWHSTKRYNLAVVKVGRLAKYRKSDLDAFIAQRTISWQDLEQSPKSKSR